MTRWQGVAVRGVGGTFLLVACGGTIDLQLDDAGGASGSGASAGVASQNLTEATGGTRSGRPATSSGGTAGSKTKPPSAGASSGGTPTQEPSSGGAPTEPGTGGVVEPGIGGSPDELSFGGAPTYLDECASDLTTPAPVSEFECPAQPGSYLDLCFIPENAHCIWQDAALGSSQPGYTVGVCWPTPSGTRWHLYGAGGFDAPVGENSQQCPKSTPVADSSCSDHAGEICYYPTATCSCAAEGATWACDVIPDGLPAPNEVRRLCPPDGIDESKQVKDLSEAEVLAWCNWYADPSGGPRPELRPEFEQTDSYVTRALDFSVVACVPDIPVELCVRNLRARPECTATLGDLDDCIETLRALDNPPTGWVGHGCAVLLSEPSCEGVVVSDDCVLPLD